MRESPDRAGLNRLCTAVRPFAGPIVVSVFATWVILSFGLTQLIPEAEWLYVIGSALLLTIGIGLSVLGTVLVMNRSPEE